MTELHLETIRLTNENSGLVVRPVLEQAIIDSQTQQPIVDEVNEVEELIQDASMGRNERNYVAAVSSAGLVLGVMGFRPVGEVDKDRMSSFVTAPPALEIVNALSLPAVRGRGVGYALRTGIEEWGRELGFRQLVLNSGPRYRETGWPFWNRSYGRSVGQITDCYGPGLHAPVWRHDIAPTKNEK